MFSEKTAQNELTEILDEIRAGAPELEAAVLVLLPENVVLGLSGGGSAMDNEPLARACHRCFTGDAEALELEGGASVPMEEYLLIADGEVFVFERGRREPRIALAASSRAEVNAALLLSEARRALDRVERVLDLADLGV